jgi:hypothetical protein
MIGSSLGLTGGVVGRAHLVEEQERPDVVETGAGEGPGDAEALSFQGPGSLEDGERRSFGGHAVGHVIPNIRVIRRVPAAA